MSYGNVHIVHCIRVNARKFDVFELTYRYVQPFFWNCRIDHNNIIKVGDFGLAQHTYDKTYFRQDKRACVKLPVKWLSVESMVDGIFSEKTDVVREIFNLCFVLVLMNHFVYILMTLGIYQMKLSI